MKEEEQAETNKGEERPCNDEGSRTGAARGVESYPARLVLQRKGRHPR